MCTLALKNVEDFYKLIIKSEVFHIPLRNSCCMTSNQLLHKLSFTLPQLALNQSTKNLLLMFIDFPSKLQVQFWLVSIVKNESRFAACAQDGFAPNSALQIEGQTSLLSIIVPANRLDGNRFFDFPFRANVCRKLPALELIAARPVPNQTTQQQRNEIKQKLSLKFCLIKNKPSRMLRQMRSEHEKSKQRQFRWFAVKLSVFRLTFAFSK